MNIISSSTRNKIVLSIGKPQFISLRYDERYLKVNALNLALLAKVAYLEEKEGQKVFKFLRFDEILQYLLSELDKQGKVVNTFFTNLDIGKWNAGLK